MDWRKVEPKYGPHIMKLFLGKLHVATVSRNSASTTSDDKYRCCVLLPGMRNEVTKTKHKTESEAMDFAQSITAKWIQLAGLSS